MKTETNPQSGRATLVTITDLRVARRTGQDDQRLASASWHRPLTRSAPGPEATWRRADLSEKVGGEVRRIVEPEQRRDLGHRGVGMTEQSLRLQNNAFVDELFGG